MKLKALLESSGKDASGLAHTLAIINDEAKEYLPSGTTLDAKLGAMKMVSKQAICYTGSGADAALGDLQLAASRAFPGSVGHDEHEAPLISVGKGRETAGPGYRLEELTAGMFVVYRNRGDTSGQLPVRLGKVLRTAEENRADAFAVVESWWPVIKDKHAGMLNAFGTWVPADQPFAVESGQSRRKRTKFARENMSTTSSTQEIISWADLLVWPVELERGAFGGDMAASTHAGRIPFGVFTYLQAHFGIDMARPEFAFARRGKQFAGVEVD